MHKPTPEVVDPPLPMAKPIIALLSDFGTRDHYAGVMKGVIVSINADVTIVDVSHELPAHDIPYAARELAATYKFFPAGTIFLVVVDPGVGSARRGIAAEAGDWRASAHRRASPVPASACSIAAWPMPLPTSAGATKWASSGARTACS